MVYLLEAGSTQTRRGFLSLPRTTNVLLKRASTTRRFNLFNGSTAETKPKRAARRCHYDPKHHDINTT
ncbi:hypothetical protein Droror1_Dr00027111, partial [Drosera rotundifolia]